MKKTVYIVILSVALMALIAVSSWLLMKQESPSAIIPSADTTGAESAAMARPLDTKAPASGRTEQKTLEGQSALLAALTEGKDSEKALTDLSAFTAKLYGLVDLDFVLLFKASGNEASLSFAGSINNTVSGKFSATETHLTIGDKNYLYAFFNSYLLLQSEYGMHILYPADSDVAFEAAYALLHATKGKTNGTSLTVKDGKITLELPDYSAKDATFVFDKNTLVVSKPNGENLAANKKATASSVEGAVNALANVNDGNASTRWSSTYHDNQWLKIDFGSVKTVGDVRIDWETAAPKDFEICLSEDGTNWTTVYTETDNKIQDGWGEYFFDATKGQYLQVKCGKRLTTYGVSIYEIEAYESYVLPKPYTYGIQNGEVFLSDGVNTYYFESEVLAK